MEFSGGKQKFHFLQVDCSLNYSRQNAEYLIVQGGYLQRIPDKMAKKIRSELSCVATLSVPDGRVWCVELKTIGHKIWFDTCWQGFVEHYSIQEGHFLIFRYEGGSNFSIRIFDLNDSEINYMSKTHGNFEDLSRGKQCTFPSREELIDNDSINILGSNPCLARTALKGSGVEQQDPSMKSNRPSLQNVIRAYDESIFGFNKENRNAASFYGNGTNKDDQHLIKNSQISLSSNRVVQNVGLMSEILSGNELKTSTENVGLHIQDEENLLLRFSRDIRNQTNENEDATWTEEIGLHSQNHGERRFPASNLQTKIIEPSEHEPPAKRIKSNSRLSTRARAVTVQEEQNAIDAATNFMSSNPFCKVVLKPSCVYRGFLLHMPPVFCKEYMNEVTRMIRLQNSDGKQWAVRCIDSGSRFMLSKGWVKFVKDNNLEEGDVCIFELIQVKDTVLKVTIFRVIEDTAPPTQSTDLVEGQQKFETRGQPPKIKSCTLEPSAKRIDGKEMNGLKENFDVSTNTRALMNQEKQRAIDAATNFKTNNPYCMVVMKPSSVSTRFLLHMPVLFCNKYMHGITEMIKLQDSEGKHWPVRYLVCGSYSKLSKGWLKFVRDNNLEEGDVCVFELIQTKETVLRVTIFHVLENTAKPQKKTTQPAN